MAEITDFSRDDNGNITVRQGKTLSWEYAPFDGAGVPISTVGLKARMQVRASYDSYTPLLSLTTEGTGATKIENTGTSFVVYIAPEATAYGNGTGIFVQGESLEGVFDVEVIDESTSPATVTCYDSGTFTILREVTREI